MAAQQLVKKSIAPLTARELPEHVHLPLDTVTCVDVLDDHLSDPAELDCFVIITFIKIYLG